MYATWVGCESFDIAVVDPSGLLVAAGGSTGSNWRGSIDLHGCAEGEYQASEACGFAEFP